MLALLRQDFVDAGFVDASFVGASHKDYIVNVPLWYWTVDVASPQRARGAWPALMFVD